MNSISLVGRLTRDPELEQTPTGTDVCRIRVAVPRRRKDGKDQGAVFVDVVTFGTQATTAAHHLAKGRQVGIDGRLEYREWAGPDGSRRSAHEVVADHVEFLGQPSRRETTDRTPEPAYNGGGEAA